MNNTLITFTIAWSIGTLTAALYYRSLYKYSIERFVAFVRKATPLRDSLDFPGSYSKMGFKDVGIRLFVTPDRCSIQETLTGTVWTESYVFSEDQIKIHGYIKDSAK